MLIVEADETYVLEAVETYVSEVVELLKFAG